MNMNPNDLARAHGVHPARYLNLASGDGILVLDVQAACEVIALAEGLSMPDAEARAASVSLESVKRPRTARELYLRLRGCNSWDLCPHGYSTVMSLSAAGPQRIGPFLVRAPWHSSDHESLDIVIQPGLSFGLGTHATTRLPLLQLPSAAAAGARCADVGCGSGVIAIAMARLGASEVVAVDIDAVAVSETAANVEQNGVSQSVSHVYRGSASDLEGTFALITANMGGAPSVIEIAPHVSGHLAPGGLFLASGIYGDDDDEANQVADGVSAALESLGMIEEKRDLERHCVGIVYRRRK